MRNREHESGPRSITIEACVASVESALAAVEGGADRLELNTAIDRDGLTPPLDLLESVLGAVEVPVIAMVRPHDDGFVYSESDLEGMLGSIERLEAAGAAGVAIGPLRPDGAVDAEALGRIRNVSRGEVVFHRAFDTLADQLASLETLVARGVARVLTSGGARTATDGIGALSALVTAAGDRIEVLPGAGVAPENAPEIVRRTGCSQLHGTFRDASGSGETSAVVVRAVRLAAESSVDGPS